jgi:CheY-like chemotaxis protein
LQSAAPDRQFTVLIAEDDPDDRTLLEDAFMEVGLEANLVFVENGEALLCYLQRDPEYSDRAQFPDPDLILLDLNMPRKNGREALAEIKGDEQLRHIPTVVLTTSRSEEDIASSYAVGANSYIVKPATFKELVGMAQVVRRYWLEMVDLPQVNIAEAGTSAPSTHLAGLDH